MTGVVSPRRPVPNGGQVPRRRRRGRASRRQIGDRPGSPRNFVDLLYCAAHEGWGTTARLALLLLLIMVSIMGPPIVLGLLGQSSAAVTGALAAGSAVLGSLIGPIVRRTWSRTAPA